MEFPELVRLVRVVAVSPGDVQPERKRLAAVVEELNRRLAPQHGCRLELWRWETDAHPGLHLEGPQGLIDVAMRIEDADVVIGIFWKRFGTPTLDSGSGTEHELRLAWASWQSRGRPEVIVYFCERKSRRKDASKAAELQKLLSFRDAMPKEQLWWTYITLLDFERAVREHLTAFVPTAQRPTAPTIQTGETRTPTEGADHPRTADKLARSHTVAGALGGFALLAGVGLAMRLGTPTWLANSLLVAGILALAGASVLSILELRSTRSSVAVAAVAGKRFRRRLAMAAGVVGLMLAAVGLATRHERDSARAGKPEDVPYDTTVGTGPYKVNGTCSNNTCVLYERRAPSSTSDKVARLEEGQKLTIVCQTKGGMVKTRDGSSNIWNRLYDRRVGPYVSDHFTTTPSPGGFTTSIACCSPASSSARGSASPP